MFLADQMLISFDIRIDQFFRYSVFKVLTAAAARLCLASPAVEIPLRGLSAGQCSLSFWLYQPSKAGNFRSCPFIAHAALFFINKSGSHLLFHTVSSIVPSAVQVLTVVFGMRTGVTPARIATGQTYLPSYMTTYKKRNPYSLP